MSYAFKKGASAIESATTEKKDFSKAIKSLKSGTSVKVRVPSTEDVVEVFMHSVYEVFYSTPCVHGDLYDKAVQLLRADQKEAQDAKDEKLAELIGTHAYALSAKPRYLCGFIDLETGEPIIIDLSKKQVQGIITTIKKYEKKLDVLAFEISKTGTSQSTVVSFNPLMFLDEDLTEKELKNFNESAGKQIDEEIYANCLYVKDEAEQVEDVLAYESKAKRDKKNPIDLKLAERLGLAGKGDEGEEETTEIDIEETDATDDF